jgi:hypothetical protein
VASKASILTTTVILALAAAGCGSTPTPTTPAPVVVPDSVSSIVGLSPVLGTTLAPGQAVTFTGTAGYALNSAGTGGLVMVIQDQANRALQATQPNAQVVKGSGEATLSQTITLPATGITGVRLFFVLLPTGATNTISNVAVTYSVR